MPDFSLNPMASSDISGSLKIDLSRSLMNCSAQDMIAALMLQHPNRSLMQRVVADLYEHPAQWKSFFLGPDLLKSNQNRSSGSLVCLRDLALGWNANTLYVLSPNSASAEAMRSIAKDWNCVDVKTYSAEQTLFFTATDGILVAFHWRLESPHMIDYDELYDQIPLPTLPSAYGLISIYSAQALMAGLMHRGQAEVIGNVHTILNDLYSHCNLWRSFVLGTDSFTQNGELESCLKGLSTLPSVWYADRLYIWMWESSDIFDMQELVERWSCDEIRVCDEFETAHLLNLPEEFWLVEVSWKR